MGFIVDSPFVTTYEVWAATEDDFVRKAEFRLLSEACQYADSERKSNKGTICVRRVEFQNVYEPDGRGWKNA
jgi:hypothetical protein